MPTGSTARSSRCSGCPTPWSSYGARLLPECSTPLADLTDRRLELLGEVATVPLSVQRAPHGWTLDGRGGPIAVPGGDDDLLRAVVARLDHLAVETDPMRLHLDVAAVRLGNVGIVLVDAHPDALDGRPTTLESARGADVDIGARDDRALVVADLLELGAEFLTAHLLSLLPGSRTVFAHPAPPSTSSHPPVRASTVATIAPFGQVDQVVVLRRGSGTVTTVELDAAAAAVQLVRSALDLHRIGPAALEVVAQAMGGARCTLIDYSDPRELAATIVSLPAAGPRRLTVMHRFDGIDGPSAEPVAESTAAGAPVSDAVRRGRASVRVVRFDRTGALYDGSSAVLMTLAPEELDAVEALLVPAAPASRADEAAVPLGVAAAGVRLARVGGHTPPGVECFGLPNCPAGATARAMWSGASSQTVVAAAGTPGADVPGALAQAIERGLVTPTPSEQGSILDRHELARRLVALVEATLLQALDVADRLSVAPLVLGSGVLAHDGWLPADFTDAEQVDLLVEPDALRRWSTPSSSRGSNRRRRRRRACRDPRSDTSSSAKVNCRCTCD